MSQPPKTEFCLVEVKNNVLLVTINRPKQLNALHPPASQEFSKLWDWFEANGDLYVAVVTGKGRLFCAGFDLQWFNDNPNYKMLDLGSGFAGLTHRRVKKPIIAAVNGPAFGGGFELALACDLILASSGATFALSEPAVGLAALGGGLVRLPHLVGAQRAHEIVLTAQPIDANQALSWGIVNRVVELLFILMDHNNFFGLLIYAVAEELLNTAVALANKIARNSPDSIIASKAIMNLSMDKGVWEALVKQGELKSTQGMMLGENRIEGIKAFNEKRRPNWKPSKL